MKSATLLDSAVFHLTPTRTRCDLSIIANGKKEKIASGLLNPFLAHLKAAQDQIEKGGYSILLEPDPDEEATWFTKGTVERFVRFVSTPEILERVYTLELEILQIEEAIAIQGNNDTGQNIVEEHEQSVRGGEGHKPKPELGEEKAIVLYTPGQHQPQTNSESSPEKNSRVQLLKVLETRKTVIKKEQGMAFARAVAAGFEIESIYPLVSFAKCFGASRLMDACIRFSDLWKKKHENGQWLEVEAAQSISGHPVISPSNSSGIVLSTMASKDSDLHGDLASPINQRPQVDVSAGERPPVSNHVPVSQQEFFQGQFPNQMFPTWPIHSPPGVMPMFPAYPVQGMPYYQSFPGNVPFCQPPHPQMEDYWLNATPKAVDKRQTMAVGDSTQNSGNFDSSTSKTCSPDGLELDKEASKSWKSQKKSGRSHKNKSDVVVIRNINYIASEGNDFAASGSSTDSETDCEGEDFQADNLERIPSKVPKQSKRKGSKLTATNESNNNREENFYVNQGDNGDWQAFQSFILKGADEGHTSKGGLFAMEKDTSMKRRPKTDVLDPLSLGGSDSSEIRDRGLRDVHEANGKISCKFRTSNDAIMFSGEGIDSVKGRNDETNMHFMEANGRNVIFRSSDDNIQLKTREDQFLDSLDPLNVERYGSAKYRSDAVSSNEIGDESFIMPFRSSSMNQVESEDRTAIDMDSELPSSHQKSGDKGKKEEVSYEAHDLNLIPKRGIERGSTGYDPALDYEIQVYDYQNAAKVANDVKKGTSKSDRSCGSKAISDTKDKKRTGGPIRKPKPSKMSPPEDARARADKLRAFKADMQKMKKEKEDADLKRLEALKLERQQRISAKNSSSAISSTAPFKQMRKVPSKLSPIINRGSKFSDLETGSSSPLQRSKVRVPVGSGEYQKASKSMKPSEGSLLPGKKLSSSVPSLPRQKGNSNTITSESKASAARIRRLSEPKTIGQHSTTANKTHTAEPTPKVKPDGPDSKKISAIINLDKSKAASLPELKIRTPKGNASSAQNELTGKEAKPPATLENSGSYLGNVKAQIQDEVDDNMIIDKKVVVLEYDSSSIPAVQGSGKEMRAHNFQNGNHQRVEEHRSHSEQSSVRAKPVHFQHQLNSNEVTEGPFTAPFARNSSLEEPVTRNSDCGEPSPTTLRTVAAAKAYVVTEKAHGVDSTSEASDKNQVKESPKGLRRLLKFGKKNHSPSVSIDEGTESKTSNSEASSQVHTLKNLISEDETPVAGSSSNKSSRHFSLLSPFRSKTSEKKMTT